jgi:hypothetical protein
MPHVNKSLFVYIHPGVARGWSVRWGDDRLSLFIMVSQLLHPILTTLRLFQPVFALTVYECT